MEEPIKKRNSRALHLISAIACILWQIVILWMNKWSFVAAYSFCCHEKWIQIVVWVNLFTAAYSIIKFINYNHKPEEEKEEDGNEERE